MDRADEAKHRLQALHQPVPRPTKAAVAQNRAEEASRHESGMFGRMMSNFRKHPDVAQATKVGQPTLVDPKPVSATEVVQEASRALMAPSRSAADKNKVSIETVGTGAPPAGEAVPRSDAPPPADSSATADPNAAPANKTGAAPPANSAAPASDNSAGPVPAAGELKPNVAPDPNELKPNVVPDGGQPLPPPQQVNEIPNRAAAQPAASATTDKTGDTTSSSKQQEEADDADVSSSKKKKKKGLRKIVPF